jgi:hypothetical protein
MAYCDARLGRHALAARQIAAARERDPGNWELIYGQALVEAAAGRDPSAEIAAALRLNPLESVLRVLTKRMEIAAGPGERASIVRSAPLPLIGGLGNDVDILRPEAGGFFSAGQPGAAQPRP